jgi:hypothetical protein
MDSAREFAAVFVLAMGFAMAFMTVATPLIIFSLWILHSLFPSPNTEDPGPK